MVGELTDGHSPSNRGGLLDSHDCGGEVCRGVEDSICGSDGGDQNGVVVESESVGDGFAAGVSH